MQRHARISQLYLECVELSAEQRADHLARTCGEDRELSGAVEAMLDFDARRPEFLAGSAVEALEPEEGDLPRSIGRYRILRKLGEGGMGAVYEAEQDHPHRTVALKVLRQAFVSSSALRRFELEGELLGRLQHPGIAQIHDSGQAETGLGPQPWFAMELVRGEPLSEHARSRGLSARERLELVMRVCDAVQHAHQHGVIHRDLKPGNILVDASGCPKILDFGIARVCDTDVQLTTRQTDVGQILGTLAYMSPEQASGDPAAIDTRSDVYSLGVILYELLAERLPYDLSGKQLPDAVRIIREDEPRRLSAIQHVHRGDVETIVHTALEKDKRRRYASAAALGADIQHFLRHEPIEARPPSRVYTLKRFVRRNRTLVGATLAVIVALASGLVAAVHFGLREAEQRRIAEGEAYRANLSLAHQALRDGNPAVAGERLDTAPDALRNWEWRTLHRQLEHELTRIAVPGVFAAAFLDEERVLTVDQGCTTRIWNSLSGESTVLGPTEPSGRTPLALTDDGHWLLSHADGSLYLADPRSDAPPVVIPFDQGSPKREETNGDLHTSAVAPDGSRVVVTTENSELHFIDLAAGTQPVRLEAGPDVDGAKVFSVAFSPDGSLVAVGGVGGCLLLDLKSGERRGKWTRKLVQSIAFDSSGTTLAFGAETVIEFIDVASCRSIRRWTPERLGNFALGWISHLSFGAGDRFLAVTSKYGAIWILEVETGRRVAAFRHEGRFSTRSAFSSSGVRLLSCGRSDETVRLWRSGLEDTSEVLRGHTSFVYPVAFDPDGKTLASGSWDRTVRWWDVLSGEQIAALGVEGNVWCLAFSPDGRQLACGHQKGFDVRDARTGRVLAEPRPGHVLSVAYSPDGELLAAGTSSGRVHLWDARALTEVSVIEVEPHSAIAALAFAPDGSVFAAGGSPPPANSTTLGVASLSLWDVSSLARLARIEDPVSGAAHYRGALTLAFSPDGGRLVAGWGNSALILLEVPSLVELQRLRDQTNEVFAAAFSPDGTRIASGGRDRFLRLWDAETGQLLLKLEGHGDYIYSLAFSPDGSRIATGSGDTTVRLWDSVPPSLRWRERRAILLRPQAERLVGRLHDELGDASAVAARIEEDEAMDPLLRSAALHTVLNRQARAEASEPGNE
ncbi:MAG: protein kinase [Planctomycetes bacterium]|nr:protein kinase [Planctomycetota bacterium]